MTVGGKSLPEVSDLSIVQARTFFSELKLEGNRAIIAARILKEIDAGWASWRTWAWDT